MTKPQRTTAGTRTTMRAGIDMVATAVMTTIMGITPGGAG